MEFIKRENPNNVEQDNFKTYAGVLPQENDQSHFDANQTISLMADQLQTIQQHQEFPQNYQIQRQIPNYMNKNQTIIPNEQKFINEQNLDSVQNPLDSSQIRSMFPDIRLQQNMSIANINLMNMNKILMPVNTVEHHEQIMPLPFQIKSETDERDDNNYYYDSILQGFPNNMNAVNSALQADQLSNTIQHENQMFIFNNQTHIQTLNLPAIDVYGRQQFIQTYTQNHIIDEHNPENLVIQRPFEGYPIEKSEKNRVFVNHQLAKAEKFENNTLDYQDSEQMYGKSENDASIRNKLPQNKDLTEPDFDIKGEYTCALCNGIFPSKRSLKQHTKNCSENDVNEKMGKFSCNECSYKCQSLAILKIHERTHTGEKPFSCSFCGYKSGQKNNVAKHILVHMKEKPFRCQYCDYRCAQKNNLVVHERTHTGFKPFACTFCEYKTVQKPNLVKHMYLHTDQKPFSCDQCGYRCVQKTNLTKHKQRHLNEKNGDSKQNVLTKPYKPRVKMLKCDLCPYKSNQQGTLDKHMELKHPSGEIGVIVENNMSVGSFDHQVEGMNLMKAPIDHCEVIQNLSIRKDEVLGI